MRTFEEYVGLAEEELRAWGKGLTPGGEERLPEACLYSVYAGGKRLRPALLLAAAESVGVSLKTAMPYAVAVELIHTYSLIHDDLPAMDNDSLRRGKPTSHVVFGEAMAILAGDALLTEAFELMSRAALEQKSLPGLRALHLLAKGAGMRGMVGGQSMDLLAETNAPKGHGDALKLLESIQKGKTAALIRGAMEAGAALGEPDPVLFEAFGEYGETIAHMFQVADDILDVVSSREEMGKSIGKDAGAGKLTTVSVFGLDGAKEELARLHKEALVRAGALKEPEFFSLLTNMLANRKR